MLKAVLFDMDDTIVDWSHREGEWNDHNRRHLIPIYNHLKKSQDNLPSLDTFIQIYLNQMMSAWNAVGAPEWDSPYQPAILNQTLHLANVNTAVIDIEHIARLFAWDAIPGVRPFEHTIPLLSMLREIGLKIGLVTNSAFPMWIRNVELETLGLLKYFESCLTAGDVGKLKPHPRPFYVMLERLGIEAAEAVFVGDRVHDDVLGAQRVGMRAVWIRRPRGQHTGEAKPNAIIDRLDQLPDVFDLWFPGWR